MVHYLVRSTVGLVWFRIRNEKPLWSSPFGRTETDVPPFHAMHVSQSPKRLSGFVWAKGASLHQSGYLGIHTDGTYPVVHTYTAHSCSFCHDRCGRSMTTTGRPKILHVCRACSLATWQPKGDVFLSCLGQLGCWEAREVLGCCSAV